MNRPSSYAVVMSTLALRKFLAFRIREVEYIIDILSVKNVCPYETPTPAPHLASVFAGVLLDEQGEIPVVEMRTSAIPDYSTPSPPTAIILINVNAKVVGLIVDSVSGVISLDEEQLRPLNGLNAQINNVHVQAIRGTGNSMQVLLDVEAMLDRSH